MFGKIGPDINGLLIYLFYGAFHGLFSEGECHFVAFGHAAPPVLADVLVVDPELVSLLASVAGAGVVSVFSDGLLLPFLWPTESTGFL